MINLEKLKKLNDEKRADYVFTKSAIEKEIRILLKKTGFEESTKKQIIIKDCEVDGFMVAVYDSTNHLYWLGMKEPNYIPLDFIIKIVNDTGALKESDFKENN